MPLRPRTPDEINAVWERREALNRLRELQTGWGERLDPHFTGPTGLQRWDARGWSQMLGAQQEAQNLQRQLGGRVPLGVEVSSQPLLSTEDLDPANPRRFSTASSSQQAFNEGTPERQAQLATDLPNTQAQGLSPSIRGLRDAYRQRRGY